MNKLIEGLYSLCDALQPIGVAVGVVAICVAGIVYIKDGADGKMKIKENMVAIIIGLAICLLAPTIGKEVAGWFM